MVTGNGLVFIIESDVVIQCAVFIKVALITDKLAVVVQRGVVTQGSFTF